jgi:UDP-glucose:(heptosyl)LPS alpha-1,3-glucosyltransferase
MNIAIVIQDLRMRGGLERRTSELAKQLLLGHHEVHVYANRWDLSAAEGAAFHRVSMLKFPRAMKPLSFAWNAGRLAGRGGHDIVHTQARLFRYDVVSFGVGCHKAFLDATGQDPERSGDKWFHRAVMHIEREMFKPGHYRRIITNSQKVRRELHEYHGVPESDVTVIRNGVDQEQFSPTMRDRMRAEARSRLGLHDGDAAILLVGTGFRNKGVETLIRAAGLLAESGRAGNTRVVIAGAGKTEPYQRIADDLGIGDSVIWTGRCAEMERLYAAADIYALPTLYDAFSNSTLEALACGLPVITTHSNGASEILTDGVDAFIVGASDVSALAERLGALAEDAGLRERLGSAGREAIAPYTWERMARETIRVYESILADRRAG